MVAEVKIAVECSQSPGVTTKGLGSTVESVCMYVAHTLQHSLLYSINFNDIQSVVISHLLVLGPQFYLTMQLKFPLQSSFLLIKQTRKEKTKKNVTRCRDGMPKRMQTR